MYLNYIFPIYVVYREIKRHGYTNVFKKRKESKSYINVAVMSTYKQKITLSGFDDLYSVERRSNIMACPLNEKFCPYSALKQRIGFIDVPASECSDQSCFSGDDDDYYDDYGDYSDYSDYSDDDDMDTIQIPVPMYTPVFNLGCDCKIGSTKKQGGFVSCRVMRDSKNKRGRMYFKSMVGKKNPYVKN